jgi:hypothetical protein
MGTTKEIYDTKAEAKKAHPKGYIVKAVGGYISLNKSQYECWQREIKEIEE